MAMRYPVVFLPGIIAPAAIRYGPLVQRLTDMDVVLRDLAVYDDDEPPRDFRSTPSSLRSIVRPTTGRSKSSTSMGTRAVERSRSRTRRHSGIGF